MRKRCTAGAPKPPALTFSISQDDDADMDLTGLGWAQRMEDLVPDEEGGIMEIEKPKDPDEWDIGMIRRLVPARRFMPGNTYEPKDLSPHTPVDWYALKRQSMPRGEISNNPLLHKMCMDCFVVFAFFSHMSCE
jgi:hypothetical protein